jgi:hypothetical protein
VDIHDYRRALVKIAYELSHHWLGDSYLQDAVSTILREIIIDSSFSPDDFQRSKLKGQILLGGDRLPNVPVESAACHLAYFTRSSNQVVMCIQIFDIFQACLIVSEDAPRYASVGDMTVLLNAWNRTCTESTLEDFLRSILEHARATAG